MATSFPPPVPVRRLQISPWLPRLQVYSLAAPLHITQSSGLSKIQRFFDRVKEIEELILGFATQQTPNAARFSLLLYYTLKKQVLNMVELVSLL